MAQGNSEVGTLGTWACWLAVPPGGTINAAVNAMWDHYGNPVGVGIWKNIGVKNCSSAYTVVFQRIG